MDMQTQNQWDELSDYENMVDEQQLEPDYYIDRPVSFLFFITYLFFSLLQFLFLIQREILNIFKLMIEITTSLISIWRPNLSFKFLLERP